MAHQATEFHGLYPEWLTVSQTAKESSQAPYRPGRPVADCSVTVSFTVEGLEEYTKHDDKTNFDALCRDMELGNEDKLELYTMVSNFIVNRAVANKRRREREEPEVEERKHKVPKVEPEPEKDQEAGPEVGEGENE